MYREKKPRRWPKILLVVGVVFAVGVAAYQFIPQFHDLVSPTIVNVTSMVQTNPLGTALGLGTAGGSIAGIMSLIGKVKELKGTVSNTVNSWESKLSDTKAEYEDKLGNALSEKDALAKKLEASDTIDATNADSIKGLTTQLEEAQKAALSRGEELLKAKEWEIKYNEILAKWNEFKQPNTQ